VNNWNNCDCFQKRKHNRPPSINVLLFVIYENNCRGGPKQKFLYPSRSDFKYPSDFKKVQNSVGFGCRFGICHIPTHYGTLLKSQHLKV